MRACFSMITKMSNNPGLLFTAMVAIITGVLGWGWIQQTPSGEELYGDTGRYVHEFRKLFLDGSIKWWSSDFLSGHSSAPYLTFAVPSLFGVFSTLVFGDWVGLKMVILLSLAVGAGGVYLLTYSLLRDEWTSSIAGILSLLSSQILLRAGDFEHYPSVICVTFMPFALWATVRMTEESSLRLRILSGLIWSGMTLSYPKLALMFVPLFVVFFGWLFLRSKGQRRRLLTGMGVASVVFLFCAGILLIPVMREYQWMALFQPNELAGWQKSFSIKNMISIFDRNNLLLADMPEFFRADRGQFYLGVIAIGSIGLLFKIAETTWLLSYQGSVFRLFLGMGIFSLWLCHGPYSPATGMVAFLQRAHNVPDWLIPLVWLVSLIPGILIFALLPPVKYRALWSSVAVGVYYLVPGFVILEYFPLFRDIRAPWGFWEVGFFTVPVATAVALRCSFQLLTRRRLQGSSVGRTAAISLGAGFIISVLDMSGNIFNFYKSGLPNGVFEDFSNISGKLREASLEGKVYPVSGRYFDLRVPLESGRGLCTEASWAHFKMKPYHDLFRGAHSTALSLSSYFGVAGISHMMVDKNSPFMPKNFDEILKKTFTLSHDSEHISLWENQKSLSPGFLSKNHIAVDSSDPKLIEMLLEISSWLPVVPVEIAQGEDSYPNLVGSVRKGKTLSIDVDRAVKFPLTKVEYSKQRVSPTEFEFLGGGFTGQAWLVSTEAWHPDWKASGVNGALKIRKAFGGLMAVWITPEDGDIRFTFQAPKWYNYSVGVSVLSWAVSVLFLLNKKPRGRGGFIPGRERF